MVINIQLGFNIIAQIKSIINYFNLDAKFINNI